MKATLPSLVRAANGFTLVELLVTIAIVGIISGAVLVALNPAQKIKQSNDAKIKGDVGQMAHASAAYFLSSSIQSYPNTQAQLVPNELKNTLTPPTGSSYNLTANKSGGGACDGTTVVCTTLVIWAPLLSQTANYCWDNTSGVKNPSNNTAIPGTATVCP